MNHILWIDRDDLYDFIGLPLSTPFLSIEISYSPALDQFCVDVELPEPTE